MKIIVLQHINIEDPGYIKDLMIKDKVDLTTIELDDGEVILLDLVYGALETLLNNKIDICNV